MVTKSKAPVAAKSTTVSLEKAPVISPNERLHTVLKALGKEPAKNIAPADVKWGKAIALAGGGSIYVNRSNADVRSTQKQVADWVAAGLGVARGPQSQYLRFTF